MFWGANLINLSRLTRVHKAELDLKHLFIWCYVRGNAYLLDGCHSIPTPALLSGFDHWKIILRCNFTENGKEKPSRAVQNNIWLQTDHKHTIQEQVIAQQFKENLINKAEQQLRIHPGAKLYDDALQQIHEKECLLRFVCIIPRRNPPSQMFVGN